MGVAWSEFWNMNPRIIKAISEGYSEKIKSEIIRNNNMAHLQGKYFSDAILSTVGNMFSKGKPFEYPKEPYRLFADTHVLTEEEKQREVELFFEREEARRKAWRRTHKK